MNDFPKNEVHYWSYSIGILVKLRTFLKINFNVKYYWKTFKLTDKHQLKVILEDSEEIKLSDITNRVRYMNYKCLINYIK